MNTSIYLLEKAFGVVLDEARRNGAFAARLAEALEKSDSESEAPEPRARQGSSTKGKRHRRPPGSVNPIELISQGEAVLRAALDRLELDQLKDIIAEHGMDTRKLAMKWKDRTRVADLIVAFAKERVAKGSVFRLP